MHAAACERGLHGYQTLHFEEGRSMPQLTPGTPFPKLTAAKVGGGTMTIPDDLPEGYASVLFYRAHW